MQTSKSIYALLVGINAYHNNPLQGCVRDVLSMKEYLETFFDNEEFSLHTKVLTDQQATRANIIEGFEHFQQAKDGDICLFHYTGHGARCPAPPEFWHIEPDKKHETIVCYDSRLAGGKDLLDKELSYLIWNATKEKDLHFVVVMDCCHSGTITRNEYARPRLMEERADGLALKDYLGIETYKKVGENQYSPPRGKHILLSACQDKETAKEVHVGGQPRGIFTYCLLEALKKAHNQVSYSELLNRTNLWVKTKVSDQSPQLETTHADDKNLFFFSKILDTGVPVCLISYDPSPPVKNWRLNAGALHGIPPGDENSKTVLELLDSGQKVTVRQVFSHYSIVEGMGALPYSRSYRAQIKRLATPRFLVAFAKENDMAEESKLREQFVKRQSDVFRLVENAGDSRFLIQAKHGKFSLLTLEETPFSIFTDIDGSDDASAIEFIYRLEKVNKWVQLLELTNPTTTIMENEIKLELSRITDPGNEENDAPKEEVDWKMPGKFEYVKQGGEWYKPAFQLKITNKGNRALWVSLLYFGNNFSIGNQLLPKQLLNPGESAWATDIFNSYPYRTIPVRVDDFYLEREKKIGTIRDYMKLFLCTDEFSTDEFGQKGIELKYQPGNVMRSAGRMEAVQKPDWATKEIMLEIHHPLT